MTSHEAATIIVAHLRANHVRLAYVRGEGWPTQLAEDGVPTLAEALEPILTDAIRAALIGSVKSDAPVEVVATDLGEELRRRSALLAKGDDDAQLMSAVLDELVEAIETVQKP